MSQRNNLDNIEKSVLKGLKDFQIATVERVDELFKAEQNRVLISDEVGLGKTLVAKGVIAKFAKMQSEKNDSLVKVVYICSNGAIAEQNLNRLRISKESKVDKISTSRLSMQHLNIFNQESDMKDSGGYVQLIPLTPETSFRMSTSGSRVTERALMYAILINVPELMEYKKEIRKLMRKDAPVAWDSREEEDCLNRVKECNRKTDGEYLKFMIPKISEMLNDNNRALFKELKDTCELLKYSRKFADDYKKTISKLRKVFALISIERLQPDLVIMDEFQRFRYLLNPEPESDIELLTKNFFNSEKVKMLLLSATPFKMYSTLEEIQDDQKDEYFEEFLDVMRFLKTKDYSNFETVWDNYSIQLKELCKGNITIIQAKKSAEEEMYKSICRTERISATNCADMIDDSFVKTPIKIIEQDIKSYIQLEKLLQDLEFPYHLPIDYVKSSPYLLSFMRDYQLKKNLESYFKNNYGELNKLKKDTFWLKRSMIDKYDRIHSNNARLENLMNITLNSGVDRMLWIPPSKPYYELQGCFKDNFNYSKTLIFSAWEMVPRMISCMVSYEVERRTIKRLAKNTRKKDLHYFRNNDEKEERRYPAPILNFSLKDGKANAMTLFTLMYPSQFLSDCYNPIECLNNKMTIKEIERSIASKIEQSLIKLKLPNPTGGNPDRKWYYLLPLLLDKKELVDSWFDEIDDIENTDDNENLNAKKGLITHIDTLREYFVETIDKRYQNLGRRPDDLIEVLTNIAISSPSICANRTYSRYSKNSKLIRKYASVIGKLFISKMNSPEAIAAIKLTFGRNNDDVQRKNLLEYCKFGNLQAVFDEYAHLLSNGLDKDEKLISQLHDDFCSSMKIRTTLYGVDTLNNFSNRIFNEDSSRMPNMRTHFAVAFTRGEGKESDIDRKTIVRNAFNSPFRPFILASTSIGQEGLDFHNYCRRIVHWNLPSNPIDIEQREGRINRFESLAIRQNVVKRYGDMEYRKDVWDELFKEAYDKEKEKAVGESDLIPYRGLTEEQDMIKIERIVPMYPLSKDELLYDRLIKILSLYRLTLGQARQEELLNHLLKNLKDEDKQFVKDLFINLSPYYKKASSLI